MQPAGVARLYLPSSQFHITDLDSAERVFYLQVTNMNDRKAPHTSLAYLFVLSLGRPS